MLNLRSRSDQRTEAPMRHDVVRSLGLLLVAVGLVGSLIALIGPLVGLGAAENYLFYRIWRLPRTHMLQYGLLVAGVGLLAIIYRSAIRALWPQVGALSATPASGAGYAGPAIGFAAHIVGRGIGKASTVIAAQANGTRSKALAPIMLCQILLVGSIGALAFWLNRTNLLGYIDGQYQLTLLQSQAAFAPFAPVRSTNPLQGLNDLWFIPNTLWILELSVGRLLRDSQLQAVAMHCVAAMELFAVVAFVSYRLGLSIGVAAAAGWLAVIMVAPLSYPALIYNVTPDAPYYATVIALPLLIVALWSAVGTGRIWTDMILTTAIGLIAYLEFNDLSIFTTFSYFFIAVCGLSFLAAAWPDRREFWRKALSGTTLLVALLIIGLPQALWGIISDTAFRFFPEELMRPTRPWGDCSMLFRPEEPVQMAIAIVAILGAAAEAVYGTGRLRIFATALLVYVALLLWASIFYVKLGFNAGVPIYYEFVLWGVYPMFAILPITAAWRWLSSAVGVKFLQRGQWRWISFPFAAVAVLHGYNASLRIDNDRPNVYPPTPSTITSQLQEAIGLSPGAPFRGRAVTLTQQDTPRPVSWEESFTRDIQRIRLLGNEHRTIGLWYYDIPTLLEFTHTISPQLYAVTTRYLAGPGDPQMHDILNMRRPNIGIMRLLGVRYIISDNARPVAQTLRQQVLPLPDGAILALDEIPDPNLGVSPTATSAFDSEAQAFAWLDRPDLDFSGEAIVAGPSLPPLVKAGEISIEIERGGIRIRASSPGRSLVVVPFQFSHCLRVEPQMGTTMPELHRADLLLTGLLFEKKLDAKIEYRTPLFDGAYCWLEDYADDRHLLGR